MKKIFNIILATSCVALLSVSCAKEALETAPAGQLGGSEILGDSNKAQSAIDGIYRLMYYTSWQGGWDSEHSGLASFTLCRSLMGEDHYMAGQGQGWYFFDYSFNIASDWTRSYGRQAFTWNMFYKFIAQVNYVIDNEETLKADAVGQNVLGQAYAIRAYSYYCLYESFCQGNYSVNKDKPGVPIYTKGTTKETEGVGRGTIEQLFTQINSDFEAAINYFKEGNQTQSHCSHIDLYVAYGLWARASLAQQNYEQAGLCAEEALKKSGLKRVATLSELSGFNSRNVPDAMWAFEQTADQVSSYAFVGHMAIDGFYGDRAPQCWDKWIYEQGMTDSDLRRAWGTLPKDSDLVDDNSSYKNRNIYWQCKFTYANSVTGVADEIHMRAEEMLLTLAECKCRANDYAGARALLEELYAERYSEPRDISALEDSANVGFDTYTQPASLLDEILLQRRIELWCEGTGRVTDLRRLNLGYTRSESQPAPYSMEPNSPDFIYKIPQKEFDSNPALDLSKDQN